MLICGYKNASLECMYELCWTSKVVFLDSPLRSVLS